MSRVPESPERTAALTEQLGSAGGGAVAPVVVEVVDGPGKGACARLEAGTLFVGSKPECDLAIADPAISRRHLAVELLAGAVRIRDLGSRNGTYYLQARIAEARVPIGGRVRIGRSTLRFSSPSTGAAASSSREELAGLIGRSLAMRKLFALLEKVAPTDSSVLLRGETGTGKDAVARALHALSTRARAPFQVLDCGAVNPNLAESALFGHARGAFTGADKAHAGVLEAAGEGSLLLDEIGELQPKLLRVLESRTFQRVGETGTRRFAARVIAATHRDLERQVREGAFRQDLYFRLAVVELVVPPLRQRPEDIPILVAHFARQAAGHELKLSPETLAALQCDPWPGNVRELRNSVERVLALGALEASPGPEPASPAPASFKQTRKKLLEHFEHDCLRDLLELHEGNVSAAARASGVSRRQFYRLLDKHGLGREPKGP